MLDFPSYLFEIPSARIPDHTFTCMFFKTPILFITFFVIVIVLGVVISVAGVLVVVDVAVHFAFPSTLFKYLNLGSPSFRVHVSALVSV